MAVKKIKNNSGSSLTRKGQVIADQAYYEIQAAEELSWREDTAIQAEITAGTLIVNDGASDLNAADGLNHFKAIDATCIKGVYVDDTSKADGLALKYDSTSDTIVYGNAASNSYQTAVSSGNSATTSPSYVQKLRLTTSNLPAGDYEIKWYAEQASDKTSEGAKFRIQINDTDTAVDMVRHFPIQDEYYSEAGFCIRTLDAGIYNIDMDHCATIGSGAGSQIKNAILSIMKVG